MLRFSSVSPLQPVLPHSVERFLRYRLISILYIYLFIYIYVLIHLKSISLFSLMLSFNYFSIYVSTVEFKMFLLVRLEDSAKAPL